MITGRKEAKWSEDSSYVCGGEGGVSLQQLITQSAGTVEYSDCTSAEGQDLPNECPGYDTKQSDGEVLVMLELWGMWSAPSLPSLPGPLWPGVVAPDMVLSMG